MVHYLRTENNRTIIECEVTQKDLSSYVSIPEYSNLLINSEDGNTLIWDFDELHNIRSWWWEKEEDSGDCKSCDDFVGEQYRRVGKKYNLNYITD